MAISSGVEDAIHELEREEKNIAAVIKMLRKIQQSRGGKVGGGRRARSSKPRVLSAAARKRISEAAKKRWIAYRKEKAA